jgi:hypothetical protein
MHRQLSRYTTGNRTPPKWIELSAQTWISAWSLSTGDRCLSFLCRNCYGHYAKSSCTHQSRVRFGCSIIPSPPVRHRGSIALTGEWLGPPHLDGLLRVRHTIICGAHRADDSMEWDHRWSLTSPRQRGDFTDCAGFQDPFLEPLAEFETGA